ncbi:MAG: hypothetical protein IH881_16135 [Myxococcales bacterium]|nr:hypothetical protein [Myxococcales bacterium]
MAKKKSTLQSSTEKYDRRSRIHFTSPPEGKNFRVLAPGIFAQEWNESQIRNYCKEALGDLQMVGILKGHRLETLTWEIVDQTQYTHQENSKSVEARAIFVLLWSFQYRHAVTIGDCAAAIYAMHKVTERATTAGAHEVWAGVSSRDTAASRAKKKQNYKERKRLASAAFEFRKEKFSKYYSVRKFKDELDSKRLLTQLADDGFAEVEAFEKIVDDLPRSISGLRDIVAETVVGGDSDRPR